ncbi:MAG: hybrid sensor histidine kinase/response regulator [Bryobacterales bacterium]|nr:hybrid sensor histidine kinase/response regulator [Bryobacterales bacterium]
MEDRELITDFLIESNENLARLDQEMVELEQRPKDGALLASIFRTIHTIKGTCGVLGFSTLEKITHRGENILSQVRNEERDLTPGLVSLVLEMVDAVKLELRAIEDTSKESGHEYHELIERLEYASHHKTEAPVPVCEPPVCESPAEAPPAVQPVAIAAIESAPVAAAVSQPAGSPEAESTSTKTSVADSTIRVDVMLLDKLMNLVGELVLARNQILQFSTNVEDAGFNATSQRLNLITTQLQEGVMKTRMQPIGVVWNKLPRVVRDLASACGKQIQLDMEGAGTELDKSIIEAIKDPLTHIVRNSCDHGIELPDARAKTGKPVQGRLTLRAFHEGGQVNIEISDDGRGVDPERVKQKALQKGLIRPEQAQRMSEREATNLIFLPGFSTAEQVTNISGRGVGMDVVKTNIEKIGGTVDIASRAGHGTTVKIKIPLTLAIIPGLVVMSGQERFVIPQVSLLELVRLEGESGRRQIERIHGTPVYRRRGNLLPITYLRDVLRLGKPAEEPDVLNIVILQAEDRQFGLVVDGIHDTQEIVVKPLGKQLKGLTCYAGATIMGDGKVALILDVLGIGLKSGVLTEVRESGRLDRDAHDLGDVERQSLLLFRSGRFERLAVPLSLVARLEEFPRAKIEHAGGQEVVQYRGRILPLIPLTSYLDPSSRSKGDGEEPAQVIVFSDGEHRIGVLVDQIVDIVEDVVVAKQQASHRGLLGSAVVGQKVTDFLDLHAVIENFGETWFGRTGGHNSGATILVADHSLFARGLVRNVLEMAGHRVVEAGNVSEALEKLSRHKVDMVATSLDLAGGGGTRLLDQMKQQTGLGNVPALALVDGGDDPGFGDACQKFDDTLGKFDREAMLRSVEKLSAALAASSASRQSSHPLTSR